MTFLTLEKRISPIKLNEIFDYTKIKILRKFITEYVKILPRVVTKLTVKQQKQLAKSVKRARIEGLLPIIINNDFKNNLKKKIKINYKR